METAEMNGTEEVAAVVAEKRGPGRPRKAEGRAPLRDKRESLPLYQQEWERLVILAMLTGSDAPTGGNAGGASWRTLIRRIARGELLLVDPETGNQIELPAVPEDHDWATPVSEGATDDDLTGETWDNVLDLAMVE